MATLLLAEISKKFFNGVKLRVAEDLGIKPSCMQHLTQGRPVKDWMLVHIRRKYGKKTKRSGLTDTQILDLLEKEYPENTLKEILTEWYK